MTWPNPEQVEQHWQQWHERLARSMMTAGSVSDGISATDGFRVDERLIQAIWSDQMVAPDKLTTASGKAVEVIEPGRWNTSRGPDFLDARLRLAGEEVVGDIEIHVESQDWRRHGHHQDFEYNRVALHVVLSAHDDRPYEEKQNGKRLERLVLEGALEPDLETIRQTINPGDYPYGRPEHLGICHEQLLRLRPEELQDFLITAGRSRLEAKIARYAAQRKNADFMQVLYQAILTAQGFKSSKTLYFLLAKRAPLRELIDHARDHPETQHPDLFLSALVHLSQIYPGQADLLADDETRQFGTRLEALWRPLRPYFADRFIPPTKRWYAGMRPAGFPTRRLAAVALLLGRLTRSQDNAFTGLIEQLQSTDLQKLNSKERNAFWRTLVQPFVVEGDSHYFSRRFTFGGKPGRPQALLGEPAARSLAFNVLLPLVVLHARERNNLSLETKAWSALVQFPALERNSVVKFMARRLFDDSTCAEGLLKLEVFQQALLKVFSDCCATNERTCSDCTFLALADKLRAG